MWSQRVDTTATDQQQQQQLENGGFSLHPWVSSSRAEQARPLRSLSRAAGQSGDLLEREVPSFLRTQAFWASQLQQGMDRASRGQASAELHSDGNLNMPGAPEILEDSSGTWGT